MRTARIPPPNTPPRAGPTRGTAASTRRARVPRRPGRRRAKSPSDASSVEDEEHASSSSARLRDSNPLAAARSRRHADRATSRRRRTRSSSAAASFAASAPGPSSEEKPNGSGSVGAEPATPSFAANRSARTAAVSAPFAVTRAEKHPRDARDGSSDRAGARGGGARGFGHLLRGLLRLRRRPRR